MGNGPYTGPAVVRYLPSTVFGEDLDRKDRESGADLAKPATSWIKHKPKPQRCGGPCRLLLELKAFTPSQRRKGGWCRVDQAEHSTAFRKTRYSAEKLAKERIQLKKNREAMRRRRFFKERIAVDEGPLRA